MATLQDAIDTRCSRRSYLPVPLNSATVKKLQAYLDSVRSKEGVDMRLIVGNGDAFKGLRKSYGMFSGVNNYIGLIEHADKPNSLEKLGYFGEYVVLLATQLELGTCWVGGTFDRSSCPFTYDDGERLVSVITIGEVSKDLTQREKFIRWGTHRKTKSIEQMYTASGEVPAWFLSGMRAVQKAPSAVNRQPVHFTYDHGIITASVNNIDGDGYALDLGIAKLHFELGTGGGVWSFGNGAAFMRTTQN